MTNDTVKPNKYSSLFSNASQENLAQIQSRKASVMSSISVNTSISDFMECKVQAVKLEREYLQELEAGIVEAFAGKDSAEDELCNALKDINNDDQSKRREYVALKRQRKLIEEDLTDGWRENIEKAYSTAILNRVRITQQLHRQSRIFKKHRQEDFRRAVESYYDVVHVEKEVTQEIRTVYCIVSRQWHPSKDMKAAHLVPKSLQSEELSYLFGAGDVQLSDPRNSTRTLPSCSPHLCILATLTFSCLAIVSKS